MPTADEHIAKATHNSSFAKYIQSISSVYPDWLITVYFYIALHLVDAFLATIGKHPPTHHHRETYIQREPKLQKIYPDFRELEDFSRDARYTSRCLGQQDIQDSEASLEAIKSHIRPLFPGRVS